MKKISEPEKLERLQEEFNSLKAESNKEISELKKERRELMAKIKALGTKLSTANVNVPGIKQLKDENKRILADMERVMANNIQNVKRNRELSIALSDIVEDIKTDRYDPEHEVFTDYAHDLRRDNLYHFYTDWLHNRNYNLLFSIKSLILNINPLTGSWIIDESFHNRIIEKIKDRPEYQDALKKWEPYKDKSSMEWYDHEAKILNELGRHLLPLYIDIFIDDLNW